MSIEYEIIKGKTYLLINIFSFVGLTFICGILFFFLPKDKISVEEKRLLSPVPKFNFENYKNGSLADSLDFYYSDNFILRNKLISCAELLRDNKGYNETEIKFFNQGGANNNSEVGSKKEIINTSDVIEKPREDTLAPIVAPYENIKSVVICNKRAIQLFGGSKIAAKNFSKLLKLYKTEFNNKLNIFCMAIPLGGDYYLPQKINKKAEKDFIDYLYSITDSGIHCVKAYQELQMHTKEYIQFNTDHHWTGLGAYYAYQAFCDAAGFKFVPLTSMNKKTIHNFLGTLYYYTKSNDLKENKDSVEFFKVPFETNSFFYRNINDKGTPSQLYYERASGGNAYGVFLGGDFPIVRCITPNKNGRKIIVIKDSYGNAFSPYLASHYEEVIILDYRFFNNNIKDLVNKYHVTDLLFAHNIYVANSDFAVKKETGFLKGSFSEEKK